MSLEWYDILFLNNDAEILLCVTNNKLNFYNI